MESFLTQFDPSSITKLDTYSLSRTAGGSASKNIPNVLSTESASFLILHMNADSVVSDESRNIVHVNNTWVLHAGVQMPIVALDCTGMVAKSVMKWVYCGMMYISWGNLSFSLNYYYGNVTLHMYRITLC